MDDLEKRDRASCFQEIADDGTYNVHEPCKANRMLHGCNYDGEIIDFH